MQPRTPHTITYPTAPMATVVDEYHGVPIADPYRWLEDPQSPETRAWLAAQQQLTTRFLNTLPARSAIQARLTALWDFPRSFVPRRAGTRYFLWHNDGLQPQAVLYMLATLDSAPVEVLNPNHFSADGAISVTNCAVSHDGSLLAYALSSRGSDQQEIHIRHLDSAQAYAEVLQWCAFTGIAWTHDNRGFFYNRYPAADTSSPAARYAWNRLYWHTLGTPQEADQLVYERPDNKELAFSPRLTDDGHYLLLNVWDGDLSRNRIYYREVDSDGPFIRLLDDGDAKYVFLGNSDAVFYFRTDLDAPRGRIVAIDTAHADRANWREVVPQCDDAQAFATMVDNHFAVVYMHDATHQVHLYNLQGVEKGTLALPALGSILEVSGKRQDSDLFLALQSFLSPPTIWRYHSPTGTLSVFREARLPCDLSAYEAHQVFYTSKDGTRVPMFLMHRRDLPRDGQHSTLLYAYGGFEISMTPFFAVAPLFWLEQGGIYAMACVRGGGEYGQAWHEAGILANKQNVFDDAIAAAEWLITNNYTNPTRLAIRGRSNGGLLVAACMLQRPELYGAVICEVPVTDMLRYHKFTSGRFWVHEYGNAESHPDHLAFLLAYSPLHNVKPGVAYPPIFITTADTDDRVVPLHAMKFAATLQAADTGQNLILLRMEADAGHGMGKPTGKVIEELSDLYAFLFTVFQMTPRPVVC